MERLADPPEDSDDDDDDDSYDTDMTDSSESEGMRTPLMTFIKEGDISNAQRLIESGTTNLEETDSDGDTALKWALLYSQEKIVAMLLAAGANILVLHKDRTLNQALIEACNNNSMSCIQTCLARGANINYAQPITGVTPLMAVIQSYQPISTAEVLISMGADITAVDAMGWNAIMWVAHVRGDEVHWMELLLKGSSMQPKVKESIAARKFQAMWRGFQVRQKRRSCDLGAWKVRKFGSGFMYTFVFKRPTPIPTKQDEWFMSRMMSVV